MSDKTAWVEKKFKIYEPGKLIPDLNRVYDETSYKESMENDRIKELMKSHMFPLLTHNYVLKQINDPNLSEAAKLSYKPGKELGIVTDWKIGEITTIIKPEYVKIIDDLKIDTVFHYMIGTEVYKSEDDSYTIIRNIKVIFFYLKNIEIN